MSKSSADSSTAATVVRPQDYADSPVHYAVATADYATLNSLLASLPKLADPAETRTESQSIEQESVAEKIFAVVNNRDNSLGETPLHLAVRLNDVTAVRSLVAAEASTALRNADGWDPIEEAIFRRCREIICILVQHRHLSGWALWRRRLPRLVASLRRMRDFYMEISFHFESSIIPYISKIAPSDTYKIWKLEGNLRADTTLAGFDGLKIKRANRSVLFLNDFDHMNSLDVDVPQGSLLFLKHDKKKIHHLLQDAGKPLSEAEVSHTCNRTRISHPRMDFTRAELVPRTNWRRQPKTENVGQWKAKVYEMHNVIFISRSREVTASDNREDTVYPSSVQPLENEEGKTAPPCTEDRKVAPPRTKEKEFTKSLRPMVWLTEQFPVKTEMLLPLLDMLANKNKAVRRLREVLTTTFPPSTFPVKVAIPVIPTVRVVITFNKYIELQRAEEFYTPPSSPTQDETSTEEKGKSSGRDSISNEGQTDLFQIPTDYTWAPVKLPSRE